MKRRRKEFDTEERFEGGDSDYVVRKISDVGIPGQGLATKTGKMKFFGSSRTKYFPDCFSVWLD
ncbi:unnamed protein product [Natator depressus]